MFIGNVYHPRNALSSVARIKMLVQISMEMMMIQHHVMIQRMRISKRSFIQIKCC